MTKYQIADIVFEAQPLYQYTINLCKDYEYSGADAPRFTIEITKADIEKERQGLPEYNEAYLESIAFFRKFNAYLLSSADGFVFHSSAVMVDGNAYLFTAPSGTGKSTHTKLWCDLLGDRAVMINDDKPIIRSIDGEFFVYGSPWRGKHLLGCNCKVKLKAICNLYRAKENKIESILPKQMLFTILGQTALPTEKNEMDRTLKLIEEMLNCVKLYSLGCNVSLDSATLSYKKMSGDIIDEN